MTVTFKSGCSSSRSLKRLFQVISASDCGSFPTRVHVYKAQTAWIVAILVSSVSLCAFPIQNPYSEEGPADFTGAGRGAGQFGDSTAEASSAQCPPRDTCSGLGDKLPVFARAPGSAGHPRGSGREARHDPPPLPARGQNRPLPSSPSPSEGPHLCPVT